jgi:hypothetical protein
MVRGILNDIELTEVLRQSLSEYGYTSVANYEWHNGEALYCGGPIQGSAAEGEQAAISATEQAAATYPEQYLHVRECGSGEEWIVPFGPDVPLDLYALFDQWVKREFGGELVRDGGALHGLDGEYYAKIMTDGRDPDYAVCWTGGGFFLKGA